VGLLGSGLLEGVDAGGLLWRSTLRRGLDSSDTAAVGDRVEQYGVTDEHAVHIDLR
jgi:hypothetical protein